MTYYFLKDGKNELGPFTIEQLKCRSVKRDTPVWFAGLEEWTAAEQVYALKELFIIKSSRSRFLNSKLVKIWNNLFKQNFNKKSYQFILSKERNKFIE